MRRTLAALLSTLIFFAVPCFAQVQISGTAVQIGGTTSGVSSAQGTAPIQVNGASSVPATGALTISCPTCGAGDFQMQYTPQTTGQYALIFPGGCSISGASSSSGKCGTGGFGISLTNGDATATVSNFSLPSYINPANVTSVYMSAISSAVTGASFPIVPSFQLSNVGGGSSSCGSSTSFAGSSVGAWNITQKSCPFSVLPTSYSTLAVDGELTGSSATFQGTLSVYMVVLEVHYTGSAPPASNALVINPPLAYDTTNNSLGIGPGWPNFLANQLVAALPTPSGANLGYTYPVSDGATGTDCSTGGGTWQVACTSTGSGYTGSPRGVHSGADINAANQQVVGVKGVPLCSGFAPSNGYLFTYNTGGSPNPCWNASSAAGASVPSVQATAPLRANGVSGSPQTGAITVDCPSCGGSGPGLAAPFYTAKSTATNPQVVSGVVLTAGHTVVIGCFGSIGTGDTASDGLGNTWSDSTTNGSPGQSVHASIITVPGTTTAQCNFGTTPSGNDSILVLDFQGPTAIGGFGNGTSAGTLTTSNRSLLVSCVSLGGSGQPAGVGMIDGIPAALGAYDNTFNNFGHQFCYYAIETTASFTGVTTIAQLGGGPSGSAQVALTY